MVDAPNPWSADSWNLTEQMRFFKAHGQAAAEAKARAAGTALGRAPVRAPMRNALGGGHYVLRQQTVKEVERAQGFLSTVGAVQPKLGIDETVLISRIQYLQSIADALGVSMDIPHIHLEQHLRSPDALGFDVANSLHLEKRLTAHPDLGAVFSVLVHFEKDLAAANAALGVNLAVAFDRPQLNLANVAAGLGITLTNAFRLSQAASAAPSIGFAVAAVLLQRSQKLAAASPSLGVSMTNILLKRIQRVSASSALGASMAASITRRALLVPHPALGASMAAAIKVIRKLTAAPALGITMASALSTGSPLTVSFTDSFGQNTATSTTANYTTKSFGAADPNRWIVCCIGRGVNNNSITSVSIGGVAATLAVALTSASGNNGAIYYAKVPTGTTGTVSIVFTQPQNTTAIGLWRVISPSGNLALVDSQASTTVAHAAITNIGCTPNGAVFGCCLNANAQTWNGMPLEQDVFFNVRLDLGHNIVGSGVTSMSFDVTNSGNSAERMMAASFSA